MQLLWCIQRSQAMFLRRSLLNHYFWIPACPKQRVKKVGAKVQSSGRIKSGIEITTGKKLRLCRRCNKMTRHDSRTCPENPNKGNKGPIQSHIDEDDDDEDMEEDVALSD